MTVTVSLESSGAVRVVLHGMEHQVAQASESTDEGPSPIAPEGKELLWGLGAFLVFLALMRLFLVPRIRQGMAARYQSVRSELEEAEDIRSAAQQELAEYQGALAEVRAEASARIDAARHQLEGERTERLAEVNARIASRRADAAAEAEAAKAAARERIDEAVIAVASRVVELAVGKRPDPEVVRDAVASTAGVEMTR
jgi:F-type H+-transporting ATPase subunit b